MGGSSPPTATQLLADQNDREVFMLFSKLAEYFEKLEATSSRLLLIDILTELFREIKTEEFIKFGMEAEFIGRLPVIAQLEYLEAKDLYDILKNPN